MRNKKAIFAGALMVPALALTGGVAYASTTGSHPTPARPAVTTVQAHSQHPTGQPRHDRCDGRYGDHRYDRCDHGYQRPATQRPATQRQATQRPHGDRDHGGYQGSRGYQGGGGDHRGDGCDW
jgi:hypothetical protein